MIKVKGRFRMVGEEGDQGAWGEHNLERKWSRYHIYFPGFCVKVSFYFYYNEGVMKHAKNFNKTNFSVNFRTFGLTNV